MAQDALKHQFLSLIFLVTIYLLNILENEGTMNTPLPSETNQQI